MIMNDIAIRIENLGKLYQIGARKKRHDTMRDALVASFRRNGTPKEDKVIWALKDVSFDVKRGEVVGIIGSNGAGKSTLLKILSHITEPTSGRALINGRVSSLLEVGTGFHAELTGRENIFLNGAIMGMKKKEIERQFDEIVAFSGVGKFIDTPVKHYSSGMSVRLGFSVAAYLEPEVLLVDEVLAVGDLAFQRKCLGRMGDVARSGRTVLFVSHTMSAVRKLCTRGVLLDEGRVTATGSIDETVNAYIARTACGFDSFVKLPAPSRESIAMGISLQFMSAERDPQASFHLDQAWYIRLDFEVFGPVEHFIASVGLRNFDMVPILTFWSEPADLGPGRYTIDFRVDVPLSSTDITFVVGLSSYERPLYYVSDLGHVRISDVASGEQPLRAKGGGLLLGRQEGKIMRTTASRNTPGSVQP